MVAGVGYLMLLLHALIISAVSVLSYIYEYVKQLPAQAHIILVNY